MDISPFINHQEILRQTLTGINKSFVQAGVEEIVHEASRPTFEGLINMILPVLEKLYHLNHSKFLAVLYRIDISEAMLINAKKKEGEYFIREIATLVVKRELQKAVSRNFYKNQQ